MSPNISAMRRSWDTDPMLIPTLTPIATRPLGSRTYTVCPASPASTAANLWGEGRRRRVSRMVGLPAHPSADRRRGKTASVCMREGGQMMQHTAIHACPSFSSISILQYRAGPSSRIGLGWGWLHLLILPLEALNDVILDSKDTIYSSIVSLVWCTVVGKCTAIPEYLLQRFGGCWQGLISLSAARAFCWDYGELGWGMISWRDVG